MPSWKKLLTSGSNVSVSALSAQGIKLISNGHTAISSSGTELGIGDLTGNDGYRNVVIKGESVDIIDADGNSGLKFPLVNTESYIMNSEDVSLMMNSSGVVGKRQLGSNAFTSTTIGTTTNAVTVDNTTLQLNSGTTFNGSAARTISAKTATIANGGSGLATADQIHTFVTTQTDAIDADTSGNAATATKLAAAVNIAGVAFDGSEAISLNNSNITNGAGYTTNTGDITGVTAGDGLTGGGSSGGVTVAVDYAGTDNIILTATAYTDTIDTGDYILVSDSSNNVRYNTVSNLPFTNNSGTLTGNGSSGRIAFYTGTTTLSTDADLTYNNGTNTLTLGTADLNFVSASSSVTSSAVKIDNPASLGSEATSIMIDGDGNLGTRELGSNAFNSTSFTTNTGTVTSVTINTAAGLDGSGTITTSGTVNLSLDLSELTDMTADVNGEEDELILLDNGAERRKLVNEIKLSQFNNDSGFTTNTGTVDTSGTPVDNDYAKFTDANTIEGRSASEVKTDLSLNNVENTAISTFAGSSNITTVGTIGTGTWQGTAIASAYLDSDTAHLSGTQTFSGAKTFSSTATFTNAIQLNDSDIIYLGTDQDFEIYHDGSNGYFKGKKHGGLAYFQLENSAGTNQNAIIIGESGSAAKVGVELRYNNVGRIWTTNDGSAILKPSIMGLSNQEEEATALMINGSNVVGTRELGSNAFTSTTIGTTSNALTVDNTTIQLNSGTTFNGSGARTISAKTAAIANGGSGLATADQIHTFVTTQTDAIDADTSGNAATATALATAREIAGVSFDGTANISLNNNAITNGAGYTTNTGTVDTSGTPVDNDYAKFTDANTIEGRSASEVKTDLSLNNVENTAISTFAGTSNITTVGTIGTGTWQGTAIASAYLDSDTAHLSGTQTFSGAKTFSSNVVVPSIKVGADGGIVDSEGVQAISIDDSANVLIGNGLLTVEGTGTSEFTSHLKAHCLGIGTNPSGTQGEIRATNDITAYYSSDIRLKENIHSLKGTLEKLDSIRAVSYDWKELTEEERKTVHSHTGSDIGVIAQEVEEVFPDLVEDRPNGYKAVNYEKLSAVLLSAVKELKQEVEELKQKIK